MKRLIIASLAAALSACNLMPHYQRPQSPVPNRWPADAVNASGTASPDASLDQIGWRDFFTDPPLQRLVEIALENNRNLRIAVLNVSASEAQFRVQRGNLFPAISATGSGLAERLPANGALPLGGVGGSGGTSPQVPTGSAATTFHYYTAGIGFTNYELDLFGRQRSLTTQAFEQYLAQSEARRSTQISLVAEVAADYFAVLADQALVKITHETLQSESESYELTRAMYERDTTTLLSLRQAESAVDAARASLAQYRRQLEQDTHALTLVLGQEIPTNLPPGKDMNAEGLLAAVPAGLPSDLLTHRPDILSAEHTLRAANANIGAARAAFFPSIQLTASGGTASNRLAGLFGSGTGSWSFAPTITLPIFTGGQNRANLDLAHIEKNVAVAQYELTIQTAFREVSDALSARGTYVDQRRAQESLVTADADAYRLAEMRFRSGVDSYLSTLDAQRSLYAAQQGLVTVRQAELTNQVTLYKTLGGGWQQYTR
ncbi:MAG TPA: efflux transporter outer membrane subunit [Steroidobacteraceae bacterium]|jgi:multidrug efflux system outer membrane protein|nr:efflux transporter outer membrane subunit [Steroidobacteraceae bacterium]